MTKRVRTSFIILAFLAGCAYERVERKEERASAPPSKAAVPTLTPPSELLEIPEPASMALFFVPHPRGDLSALISFFKGHPDFRATLIFPAGYFDEMGRKSLIPELQNLMVSRNIEVGLTLKREPVLPLIQDLAPHVPKLSGWNIYFKWPEDVAAQMAQARMEFQKRWVENPSGFAPPYLALSQDQIRTLQLLKLRWAIVAPQSTGGVQIIDSLALLSPPRVEYEPDEEGEEIPSIREFSKDLFQYPMAFVDARIWTAPETELDFLNEFVRELENAKPIREPLLGRQLVESFYRTPYPYPPIDLFDFDFGPWARTDRQRLAWKALAQARNVVENYKNSGQANLKKLDAAMEEIYHAEDGRFLLSLGESRSQDIEMENEFLATLANVYRLSETPVPANFNRWFSLGDRKITAAQGDGDLEPFFVEGVQELKWNDPIGDDLGDGNLTYPMGNYPKGAFDLRSFSVSWTDSDVIISFSLLELILPKEHLVNPLLDVYIDINRLPGAGSVDPLPNRTGCVVAREAAWEFALAIGLMKTELFQPVPGQTPRKIGSYEVKLDPSGKMVRVRLPRSILRGSPERWRYSVGLLGTEMGVSGGELRPISATASPRQKNFGGGKVGRKSPPYIDLLAPSAQDQMNLLAVYRDGGLVTLQYVDPE